MSKFVFSILFFIGASSLLLNAKSSPLGSVVSLGSAVTWDMNLSEDVVGITLTVSHKSTGTELSGASYQKVFKKGEAVLFPFSDAETGQTLGDGLYQWELRVIREMPYPDGGIAAPEGHEVECDQNGRRKDIVEYNAEMKRLNGSSFSKNSVQNGSFRVVGGSILDRSQQETKKQID